MHEYGDSGTEWFWRIVDANGNADVPSDEIPALRILCERASRASAAEAEVARLKAENERLAGEVAEYTASYRMAAGCMTVTTGELIAAESTASALRERVARLEEALRPFAEITPSTLHHNDGSEREPYSVVMSHPDDEADFTGADLARARAALTEGAPTDV